MSQLHKNGDRLLSFTVVDYEILTYIFAERVQKILKQITNTDRETLVTMKSTEAICKDCRKIKTENKEINFNRLFIKKNFKRVKDKKYVNLTIKQYKIYFFVEIN